MLKLTRRKNSPFWYIRGSVKTPQGTVEVFETTGSTKRTDAAIYLEEYRLTIGAEVEKIGRKTLGEASKAYIQSGGEARWLEPIIEQYGFTVLDDINQVWMDEKSLELYPTCSGSSRKRWFYTPVLTVINFSAKREWTHYRKIVKPSEKPQPPQWADLPWLEKLWAHSSPQLIALTTLLAYSGPRVGEALDIEWETTDFKKSTSWVPETKTRTPRTLHLAPIVIERLKVIKPKNSKGKVFPWWASHQSVNWAIRRACKRAGIKYMSSHKIGGHTYATRLRQEAGMDLRGLIGTGRWVDIRSVMKYTHVVASEEAKKADLLPVPKVKKRAKSVQTGCKRRIP